MVNLELNVRNKSGLQESLSLSTITDLLLCIKVFTVGDIDQYMNAEVKVAMNAKRAENTASAKKRCSLEGLGGFHNLDPCKLNLSREMRNEMD